jgi:hypothetical protein
MTPLALILAKVAPLVVMRVNQMFPSFASTIGPEPGEVAYSVNVAEAFENFMIAP